MNDPRKNNTFSAQTRNENVYYQRFTVEFAYPVHFSRGLFDPANELLAGVIGRRRGRTAQTTQVFIDRGLAMARPDLATAVKKYCAAHDKIIRPAGTPRVLPGGETAKHGWKNVGVVLRKLAALHLDRHAVVVGIGGGAMLDMLGLATALTHRGLRLVRLPTTTLAQCDAGIGVKNGIDGHGMKNFAGTFSPPFAVIADFDFLSTLSQRDWIGGVAEAFKVAMIKDAGFFDFLCSRARKLAARDETAMARIIRECAAIHLDHIRLAGDPFERGSARPLDFGHWAAHQIECMSGYRIGHGQATAIGMALDSHYAMQCGLITAAQLYLLLDGLENCGLPSWDACLGQRNENGKLRLLDGLDCFREHIGGKLTITLPADIGKSREIHEMHAGLIENAIDFLRERS